MKKNRTLLYLLRSSIMICLFLGGAGFLWADNGKFKSLSVSAGLAHTDVTCLAQDSVGLVWIGTSAGVQSYDGYSFTTYDYYDINQKVYSSHNRINSMSCSGRLLWIGTESGLTCIDMDTHLYVPYTIKEDSKEVQYKRVTQVNIDPKEKHLWIYTNDRCYVAQVDEKTRELSFLQWEKPDESRYTWKKSSFKNGVMWGLEKECLRRMFVEDGKVKTRKIPYSPVRNEAIEELVVTSSYLYLRTGYGCYRIALPLGESIDLSSSSYLSFHGANASIPEKTIGYFQVDEKTGDLWCSYWGELFHISHPFSGRPTFRSYFRNTENLNLSKISVTAMLLDSFDNLWVGMNSWGLHCKPLQPLPFYQIPKEKFWEQGYYRSEVVAVKKQDPHVIWMIIESGSLFRYNEMTEELSLVPLNVNKGIPDTFQSLYLSVNGKFLYIGTSSGLLRYEIASGKVTRILGIQAGTSMPRESFTQMQEDRWGRLWVGTWFSGVYCLENPEGNPSVVHHYADYTEPAQSSNQVTDVCMGTDFLLVATTHGFNKIVMDGQGKVKKIVTCQVNAIRSGSMSSNHLASVAIENDSTFWLGTIGGGLNKLVLHSDEKDHYTATVYAKRNGMVGNDVEIVFLDKAGHIWMGGNGISCLDANTGQITVYGSIDGLQNSSFKMGAGYQATDGTIFMGGPEGLNYFQPTDFSAVSDSNHLILSDLYINNEVIVPQRIYADRIILDKTLDKTKTVKLAYNQNVFSISFAALGYQLSNRVVYRYRMSGYDHDWNILSYQQNRIYYTHVPAGKYKVEIQVSVDNGTTWKEPVRSLIIEIAPPLWLTWWAKLLYAIVFLGIAAVIRYQYNKEQRLKRENHIQELLRKKDEERYQSKMIFFMNLSHELKTPLALIMLAVERIKETRFAEETGMILSNARKMLQLITEMVDIRKTDLGINELSVSQMDMQDMTRQICDEMTYMAVEKGIEMTYVSKEKEIWMDADADKIGKMIVNICSNAVKYTSSKGKIEVELRKGDWATIVPLYKNVHREGTSIEGGEQCLLTVRDSGVGISSESIRHIYERFFQVKGEESTHLGSGIGLAIVKNVVLLHGGTIIVSSERGVGTEIIVALPLGQPATARTAQSSFDVKAFIENQYTDYKPMAEGRIVETPAGEMHSDLPILLIVEDNKDMQVVLSQHFAESYNVKVANNGSEGLVLCESVMPDIIISDVMMPEMDGIEMCRRIRNNLSIAYLPIVLLTAKSEVDDQIEGYESGADLYISKPFSMKLLDVSLKQLLEKKRLVFASVAPDKESEEASVTRQSLLEDEKEIFRAQLHQLIEDNLSNPELSVDFFCQQLFMGKTKLWQRVKECCGESLAEYVRHIRLEKAAMLLRESTMNITEIKYEVGYLNSSHFARAFKQKYGVSPSDYLRKQDE